MGVAGLRGEMPHHHHKEKRESERKNTIQKERDKSVKEKFLVSGRSLACQQEISLVLAKTPPTHYLTIDG